MRDKSTLGTEASSRRGDLSYSKHEASSCYVLMLRSSYILPGREGGAEIYSRASPLPHSMRFMGTVASRLKVVWLAKPAGKFRLA